MTSRSNDARITIRLSLNVDCTTQKQQNIRIFLYLYHFFFPPRVFACLMTAEALTDRPSSAPQPPDGFLAKAAVIVYATFTKVGETKSSASDAQLGLPAAHLHPAVASPQGRSARSRVQSPQKENCRTINAGAQRQSMQYAQHRSSLGPRLRPVCRGIDHGG